MKLIITLLVLSLPLLVGAQTNFYKQFSGSGYDYANGVIELPDSSYMITGSSSSFLDGPSQMFLLHIDSLGNFIWSHSYGQDGSDGGQRVKQLSTGEYFVGGYTNSTSSGAYDMALWKIAEDGQLIWLKTYGSISWEKINDIILTDDDGLIIVGQTDNTVDGHTDAFIFRVDVDGNVLWEKQYENAGEDNVYTIEKIGINSFAIGGTRFNSGTNLNQAWLAKIDGDGNELWTQSVGSTNHFFIQDIMVTGTKIYCTGYTTPDVLDSAHMIIIICEQSDGTILIENIDHNIGSVGMHLANFEYIDAAAIGVSKLGLYSFGLEDNLIYGFSIFGDYYKTIGTVQYATTQVMGDMHTTYNRGMIAVGYNRHIGPGGSSIYVFRAGINQPILTANDAMNPDPLVTILQANQQLVIEIYPNPTKGIIKITNEANIPLNYQLLDLVGNEIRQASISQSNTIDLSGLTAGMYYLKIIDKITNSETISKIQLIN